ncbi:MAG: hypothetical protein KC620_07670 [Myxococcales bacterium]|nr:hypothetical protein [Myxococcales bacterium]
MSRLFVLTALLASPVVLRAAPPAEAGPPEAFLAVVGGLAGSGFHVNTTLTDAGRPGYEAVQPCAGHWGFTEAHHAAMCTGVLGVWRTAIVSDAKVDGQWAVQEFWALAYGDSARAAEAARAMDDTTFNKHPFLQWSSGRFVFALEGRFRFPTPRRQLGQKIDALLARVAPRLVRPPRFD